MKIAGRKVLVTGAGGFIGSHLVEELSEHGAHVIALVHYNSLNHWGWLENLTDEKRNSVEIIAGDIRDPHGISAAMKGCSLVFHLAALIGIPYSYRSPDDYVDVNIKGTLNVLQAARDLGIEKVLHTSTSEVYGTAQFTPITEDHPINPQSPYAATKAAADFLALSFHRSFDLPVTVVRPFNAFGPRQSARALIPTVIAQALSGSQTVKLGSLQPIRDFTFVDDTVRGFICAAESDSGIGEVVNIGSGTDISVGNLAQKIISLTDRTCFIKEDPNRIRPAKSEVNRLLASSNKALLLFGWKPTVDLYEGLTRTIEWFRNPDNLKLYKRTKYVI
jgi:NAD dependent epimerase/dehydratase